MMNDETKRAVEFYGYLIDDELATYNAGELSPTIVADAVDAVMDRIHDDILPSRQGYGFIRSTMEAAYNKIDKDFFTHMVCAHWGIDPVEFVDMQTLFGE